MLFSMFRGFILAIFIGSTGFFAGVGHEVQYKETPVKSEPRPVYPPMKKKPYTRTTRLA